VEFSLRARWVKVDCFRFLRVNFHSKSGDQVPKVVQFVVPEETFCRVHLQIKLLKSFKKLAKVTQVCIPITCKDIQIVNKRHTLGVLHTTHDVIKHSADALVDRVMSRHACPDKIISDRGSQFISKLFRRLSRRLGVKNLYTTAYHPNQTRDANAQIIGSKGVSQSSFARLDSPGMTTYQESNLHIEPVWFTAWDLMELNFTFTVLHPLQRLYANGLMPRTLTQNWFGNLTRISVARRR
jgi:hypothetical protein